MTQKLKSEYEPNFSWSLQKQLFHCSCPPSEKTHICSTCKASTREIPPGRQHQRTFRSCSLSAGGFQNTLKLWTVWKLFTTETELSAECGTWILHLSSLAVITTSSAAGFTIMLPLRAAPCPKQSSAELPTDHTDLFDQSPLTTCIYLFIWPKLQPGLCLHGAGVTHSPSPLQCRMSVHKVSPQPSETLSPSAFLRCSSQSKCRTSRDSNHPIPRAVRPWSLACLVESTGTILNCHSQYFLHILATNILVSYMTAQKHFLLQQRSKLCCSFLLLPWLSSWFILNIHKGWLDWNFSFPI